MGITEEQVDSKRHAFSKENILTNCRAYFSSETERTAAIGEAFVQYFIRNSSSQGVLFKTIKEITAEINISHQTLSKVLRILESKEIIYRRNGIIGLKENQ